MKLASWILRAAAAAVATARARAAEDGDGPASGSPLPRQLKFLRASAAGGAADFAAAVVGPSRAADGARRRAGGRGLQGTTTCAAEAACSSGICDTTGAGPDYIISTCTPPGTAQVWGMFFDVEAKVDVSITDILYRPMTTSGDDQTVNVHTRSGGHAGNEKDSNAWTQIAENVQVPRATVSTMTLPTPVGIMAGSTQAFYLYVTSLGGPRSFRAYWPPSPTPAGNAFLSNDHVAVLSPTTVQSSSNHNEFGTFSPSHRQLYGGIGYVLSPQTAAPSKSPSKSPSSSPSKSPTASPSQNPTGSPTTASPSKSPSSSPSKPPTTSPSQNPTGTPTTASPSKSPSSSPTGSPTTGSPSTSPTTGSPSTSPTTASPTVSPTGMPTSSPTTPLPTKKPTPKPTSTPTPGSFWYPDWRMRTQTCKNDGREPGYMKVYGNYYESSLRACCERYFSWDIIMCVGDEEGFSFEGYFPNWLASGENRCFGEDETDIPDYMRNNPGIWLEGEVESCCLRYFSWDYNQCLRLTSGSTAAAGGTSEWWVDWSIQKCVKDCDDATDGDCGGLAKPWDDLFVSANDCCASKLYYVERSECTVA